MATAQTITAAQQSDLERAIERTTTDGSIVLAQGQCKRDGARLFWMNSHSHPDGGHIVVWVQNRLICNGQARQICKHRAAVHMYLVNQTGRAQARAEAIEKALRRETVAERRKRLLTPPNRWTTHDQSVSGSRGGSAQCSQRRCLLLRRVPVMRPL